jgi:hypothetical protein
MAYRMLATGPVLGWAGVAVAARTPVAVTPLALVFLVRERPEGYALGALLAAAYCVGEVTGAVVLGARLRTGHRARRGLAAGLVGGAAAFAALAVLGRLDAPIAVLAVCAVLAGAAPAAAPGGLRAVLITLVPERSVVQALSAETVLTFGIWALAPPLATGLALGLAPAAPLLLAAALAAGSALGLYALPRGREPEGGHSSGVSGWRTLAMAWPLFTTGAAAMSLFALAELVLPGLLEQRGIAVVWAGPLLAGYALASAAGAFCYGLRRWPGALRTQGLVLVLGVAGCVALAGALPTLVGIAVALTLAGIMQAGVQVVRSLSLREVLPPEALGAGFSAMYAAVGVGYAASAVLSGAAQAVASPAAAIFAGVALTVVLTLISALGERPNSPLRRAALSGPLTRDGAGGGGGGVPEPGEVSAEGPAERGGQL